MLYYSAEHYCIVVTTTAWKVHDLILKPINLSTLPYNNKNVQQQVFPVITVTGKVTARGQSMDGKQRALSIAHGGE